MIFERAHAQVPETIASSRERQTDSSESENECSSLFRSFFGFFLLSFTKKKSRQTRACSSTLVTRNSLPHTAGKFSHANCNRHALIEYLNLLDAGSSIRCLENGAQPARSRWRDVGGPDTLAIENEMQRAFDLSRPVPPSSFSASPMLTTDITHSN